MSAKENFLNLPGIGKKIAQHFARLDIYSLQDLLFHFPSRYQDRTRITSIRQASIGEEVVIEGEIQTITKVTKGKTKCLCELRDASGIVFIRFFYIAFYQIQQLKVGTRLRCYGEIRLGTKGREMVHPEYKILELHFPLALEKTLTPTYPATEGLSQYMLRKFTEKALALMHDQSIFSDLFSEKIFQQLNLPTFKEAINFLHRPPCDTEKATLSDCQTPAHKRLIFEEMVAHRLSVMNTKNTFQAYAAFALIKNSNLLEKFSQQLPFKFTNAQTKVINEILTDLSKTHPMLRLLQGDVGSGKTVVAAMSMLQTVDNGFQAALMGPTELLAEQYYRVFKNWLEPLGIQVVFLSGSVKGKLRAEILNSIASGKAQIILGTHALFQQEVNFHQLAMIVIDEQHRFGVEQRALLKAKGAQGNYCPHQLLMTATPIPRTLAMSFYADLDTSIIDELPPGRTPVVTTVIASTRRAEIIERIKTVCKDGAQVYWVCPLIDESELSNYQAATKTFEELKLLLPTIRIGLVHGRQKNSEKEQMMHAFQMGELQLLVATTVIEVGVDVANASLMVIENAERLGLSQLHQLRGRVGRGAAKSYCVLLYQQPLSEVAKQRLNVMRETTDGFKIAEFDLQLRGPGEVLGTKQTGAMTFKVADLLRDSHYLPEAHRLADQMLRDHPDCIQALLERWVGENKEFAKV